MFLSSQTSSHLIIVEKDEPLMETLTQVASELEIKGGLISGIGAIKDVELGFYHLDSKSYERKLFDKGDFELTSLTGNISLKNGTPFVHAHITMGDDKFNVWGGHLFEAKVAVTGEFYIHPHGVLPKRNHDEAIGLDLICGV